jgi:nucleoside-diphosphate-sugar epimerase
MVKKVLITGGGGFIGTHIAMNLAEKGFKIRLFDLNFHIIQIPNHPQITKWLFFERIFKFVCFF